jgi:hypothetical protein
VAARPSRHPAAHSGIVCAHTGKQRVSEGGPGHVCTRQTRAGTRPGTRTAHEVPAQCASVGAAGARASARCPPWAASPWRSAARHSRGAGVMAGAQGTAPGPQRWPDAICSHHLDCSWGSFGGQNRLIMRAIWGEWQRLTCLPVVHEDKGKVAQDDQGVQDAGWRPPPRPG